MPESSETPKSEESTAARALTGRQLGLVSLVIAGSFVLGGVIGLVRGAVIGATFGAGAELDAFNAASRIPELLFNIVAGGALGSAFIPVYSRLLGRDDQAGAWRLTSAVLTMVVLIGVAAALITTIFALPITQRILMPSAPLASQLLAADLMRIILWTVAIFGGSGLVMGLLNANQRFLAPALGPSMNGLGMIIGAVVLAPSMGIYSLAWGSVLGALLHLGIQLPTLRLIKPKIRISLDLHAEGVGEVLRLMLPRIIGQAAIQINFVVNIILATGMAVGSLTALTVAFQLMFVVLGILGQSVGTAIFPTLSMYSAQNDTEGFRRTLSGALRSVLFLAIPASIGLILLANPFVAVIYQRGRWSTEDTLATAWALRFFAAGLSAFALQEILARAFFALHDTLTPVAVAVIGAVVNIALSVVLINSGIIHGQRLVFATDTPIVLTGDVLRAITLWTPHAGEGPFGGLALANTLATVAESAVLWLLLHRRMASLNNRVVFDGAMRTLIAAVIMGLAVVAVATLLQGRSALLILLSGALVGMVVFGGAALLLRMPEARAVPAMMIRRFRR